MEVTETTMQGTTKRTLTLTELQKWAAEGSIPAQKELALLTAKADIAASVSLQQEIDAIKKFLGVA